MNNEAMAIMPTFSDEMNDWCRYGNEKRQI